MNITNVTTAMNATQKLATWALALQYTDLTAPVLDSAVKSVYNLAGCAIGGYHQPAPHIALQTVTSIWGNNSGDASSILAANDSTLVDASTAALVNGIASHVDDYDDTHLQTIIHPAGTIMSALLPYSEWQGPVSGKEFLTAFVAGVEAELKLGISVSPEHYDVGWHITSTTGCIGAAVAVGKLLNLTESQMRQAIGIASTQVIGMQVFFGSDTKSFHIGRAAQSGMLSALLAKSGYTSDPGALEAEYGWTHVVSSFENTTAEFSELGQSWEIVKNTYKPFPCGIVIHPTIDACIRLRMQALSQGLDIADIEEVNARINPYVITLTGNHDPQTGLEAKFSVYHSAAVGLLYGAARPTEYTDEAVHNKTVIALRDKVHTTEDGSVPRDQSHVSIRFSDGTNLTQFVNNTIGSLANPMNVSQLKEKFIQQATVTIGEARAQRAYGAFLGIANVSDVGQLHKAFAVGSSGNSSGNDTSGSSGGSQPYTGEGSMMQSPVWSVVALTIMLGARVISL